MHRIFAFSARARARIPFAFNMPLALLLLIVVPSVRASEPIQTSSNHEVTGLSAFSGSQRIGFLSSGSTELLLADFRQGLRELGYLEGQTIVIEERYAEGRAEQLPALAAELIRLPVDVIVTAGAPATQAAKQATGSIPIVAVTSDPVGTGLIGRNVTGLAIGAPGLSAKRLELLKSAFPWISRVGYLADMGNAVTPLILQEVQDTADQIGVQVQTLEVRGPDDFDAAFAAGANGQLDALIALDDPLTFTYRTRIVEFAANNHLVANYERREWAEAGGLMAYGVNFHDVLRRAAGHVDKLLKGAKPAELAVEPPTKFDFTINVQTAQDLGVSFPEPVRVLATEVIGDQDATPAPAAAR